MCCRISCITHATHTCVFAAASQAVQQVAMHASALSQLNLGGSVPASSEVQHATAWAFQGACSAVKLNLCMCTRSLSQAGGVWNPGPNKSWRSTAACKEMAAVAQAAMLAAVLQEPVGTESVHAPPPLLVVCGPSGVGKGTLITRLIAEFPDKFGFSVSHTTRAPRPGACMGGSGRSAVHLQIHVLSSCKGLLVASPLSTV
jgi:hypothetical protein